MLKEEEIVKKLTRMNWDTELYRFLKLLGFDKLADKLNSIWEEDINERSKSSSESH